MNKIKILSILIVIYVNLVPFISRLWKGWDWATQYFPKGWKVILAFLFFGLIGSISAIPIIFILKLKRPSLLTLIVSIITTTICLVWMHYDFDISDDPQAAIGLLFFPIGSVFITTIVGGITYFIDYIIKKPLRF